MLGVFVGGTEVEVEGEGGGVLEESLYGNEVSLEDGENYEL